MTAIRGVRDRRFKFVQLLNEMFEDKNLSLKAKGFIGYCLTKHNDWKFHVSHLCSALKEGEKAIYSVINECIENGYAYRYQPRADNGDLLPVETIVSDSKHEIEEIKKEIESSAEFKKCLPLRHFGEAIKSDAIIAPDSNTYNKTILKKNNTNPLPPKGEAPIGASGSKVSFRKFVDLTQEQFDKLKAELGEENLNECLNELNDWKEDNPRKRGGDDYKKIRKWVITAIKERKVREAKVAKAEKELSQGSSPKKKTMTELIAKYFKHGESYNGALCYLSGDSIAFRRGMTERNLAFNVFNFDEKFDLLLLSFEIPNPLKE